MGKRPPNFKMLAESIAQGSGETLQDGEPEDRFLDRLHHTGVQVHTAAAQKLQTNRHGVSRCLVILRSDAVRETGLLLHLTCVGDRVGSMQLPTVLRYLCPMSHGKICEVGMTGVGRWAQSIERPQYCPMACSSSEAQAWP